MIRKREKMLWTQGENEGGRGKIYKEMRSKEKTKIGGGELEKRWTERNRGRRERQKERRAI